MCCVYLLISLAVVSAVVIEHRSDEDKETRRRLFLDASGYLDVHQGSCAFFTKTRGHTRLRVHQAYRIE